MGQIHAQRRECHENEMMKRAASGELSDRGALPIYGAVLALIGLDANRRISAETAVQACQWSAPPEKPEGCGVPAYNMAADIAERRRKSERAEAIEAAVLIEFARLAARDEYEAASAPAVAAAAPAQASSASVPAVADRESVAPPAEAVPVPVAGTKKHRIRSRIHPLDGVIAEARKRAVGDDWMTVWNVLCGMAEAKDRPEPLLGYSPEDGLKYRAETREGFESHNREAFRRRWATVAKG